MFLATIIDGNFIRLNFRSTRTKFLCVRKFSLARCDRIAHGLRERTMGMLLQASSST